MFKPINFKIYNKLIKLLIVGTEDVKGEVYKDSNNKATIGIGINIEDNGRLWEYIVLYYLFGLIKNKEDIDFKRFDTKDKIEKQLLKQFQGEESYKNKAYKELIQKIHSLYGKEFVMQNGIQKEAIINTAKLTNKALSNHLNKNIQDGIKDYINESNKIQKANPKKSLQELGRLSKSDLKIDTTDVRNPKYIAFKLTKEQAEELFHIIAINYETIALDNLNNLGVKYFDSLQIKDKTKRQYFREFIPFVSATYQSPNIITNHRALLQKAFEYKSRFFIWALLRYELGNNNIARRRILQSAIFNLNNKLANEKENQSEAFKTCKSIFKIINLIDRIDNQEQSYLEYFRSKEGEVKEKENGKIQVKDKTIKEFIIDVEKEYRLKDTKRYKKDSAYNIYRSSYINPDEIKPLIDIINVYVAYIDSRMPSALFENRTEFNKTKLIDSNNKDMDNEVRFKIQHIFFIDKYNQTQAEKSINAYTNNNTDKENILIILDELDNTLNLKQPNNTFLYLLTAKGNNIDSALFNDTKQESLASNDMCELFYYEMDSNGKLHIKTLSIELEINNEYIYSVSNNDIIYTYDNSKSTLSISNGNEKIAIITNYKFNLIKQP